MAEESAGNKEQNSQEAADRLMPWKWGKFIERKHLELFVETCREAEVLKDKLGCFDSMKAFIEKVRECGSALPHAAHTYPGAPPPPPGRHERGRQS